MLNDLSAEVGVGDAGSQCPAERSADDGHDAGTARHTEREGATARGAAAEQGEAVAGGCGPVQGGATGERRGAAGDEPSDRGRGGDGRGGEDPRRRCRRPRRRAWPARGFARRTRTRSRNPPTGRPCQRLAEAGDLVRMLGAIAGQPDRSAATHRHVGAARRHTGDRGVPHVSQM